MATLQYSCLPYVIASPRKEPHLRLSGGIRIATLQQIKDSWTPFTRVSSSLDSGKKSSHLCFAAADPLPSSSLPEDSSSVPEKEESLKSVRQNWWTNAAELRAKVSKWGLAAVLAYGLFDGITYTTFFVLAFLSYEKATGQNPAANLNGLLGVVVLMWGGNNVTRPFRLAGAAALSPFIDRGLNKMQEVLKLPNKTFAFMICVATFACACFCVIGVLILSRLRG